MNPKLFAAQREKTADTTNLAGGAAYSLPAKHALAQFALTGTLSDTYYADAKLQLGSMLDLLSHPDVDGEFVAKCAVHARQEGYMKDTPSFLVAWLAFNAPEHLAGAFWKVVDNGRMVRNVVQVCRSGVFGRRTIPRPLRRLINQWLLNVSDYVLMKAVPGQNPSIADVIKMTHPKPQRDSSRAAMLEWMIGKSRHAADLPNLVKELEKFRNNFETAEFTGLPQGIPFQLVDSLPLKTEHWAKLAADGGWHFTRMNLNTFLRHEVFKKFPKMEQTIAEKLADKEVIKKARVFPYQLLSAFKNTSEAPHDVREALQTAMEYAVDNVPVFEGKAIILVDCSGSMQCSITGLGRSHVSEVTCVDVAALFASAFLRHNPKTVILPFDSDVRKLDVPLNPRDSVMTNAQRLSIRGGATALGNALEWVNKEQMKADAIIVISDYESWADHGYYSGGTKPSAEWRKFHNRNKGSKFICIDLTPGEAVQIEDRPNSINVGGFSDNVWTLVSDFLNDRLSPEHMVGRIEEVELAT